MRSRPNSLEKSVPKKWNTESQVVNELLRSVEVDFIYILIYMYLFPISSTFICKAVFFSYFYFQLMSDCFTMLR